MKKQKGIIITMVILIFTLFLVGCEKEEGIKPLVVGTNPEFAPFEYMEAEKIKGFDIDLINLIGEKLGKKIEVKSIQFDGLLVALQSKKIDVVIAGLTATDERKKHVLFSEPYYLSQQSCIVEKGNNHNLNDYKHKKIGVVLGYTGDVYISKDKDYIVTRFSSASAAILALQANKVDAVILDEQPAKEYVEKNKGLEYFNIEAGKEEYSIAVNKKNEELAKNINKALNELKEEGKYNEIYNKYFN